jgi:hypothetical protein
MGQLLLQILPVALAIAVNPVPIIAAIVMTATERPVANGIAYLSALIGVSYGFGAAVLLIFHGAALGAGTRTGHIVLVLWLLFGLGFLAACVVLLVRRPKPGDEWREPGWMRWIGRLGPFGAAVVGVLLVNYEMESPALSDILAAQVSRAAAFVALAVFVAVATSTSIVPVVAYLAAPGPVGSVLSRAKAWLARYHRPILVVEFAAIGVLYTAKGASGLLR